MIVRERSQHQSQVRVTSQLRVTEVFSLIDESDGQFCHDFVD